MSNELRTGIPIETYDTLCELRDYIEILYRTQLAIENGDYDERPGLGFILMEDYLVKSKDIVQRVMFPQDKDNVA